MRDLIIAYPSKNTALKLRSFFESEGFHVSYICGTGSSALNISQQMHDGVIVCAEGLSDMSAGNIAELAPSGFDIIALTKGDTESFMSNLIYLPIPVNREELLQTVSVLANSVSGFTQRDKNQNDIVSKAKLILMEMNNMTETQAHKYLQKESMRTGKKLARLAEEIINDFM